MHRITRKPAMRFIMPCKAGQLPIEENCSAGGMVNAAGSEAGMPVPGLSNRLLHPPASDGVRGRTKASTASRLTRVVASCLAGETSFYCPERVRLLQ